VLVVSLSGQFQGLLGIRRFDRPVGASAAVKKVAVYVGMIVSLSCWRPPQRGLDAARPERGALAAAGRDAEGDHPSWQGAKRPKLGDTAARAKPLTQSAGVRSRVRSKSRPVAVVQKGEPIGDIKPATECPPRRQGTRGRGGGTKSDRAGDRISRAAGAAPCARIPRSSGVRI
jgi:hypothetical protein